MSGKQSDVTNTTTISLFLKTTDAKHKIEMSLMGTMTSSTTGKITDMKMMIPQLMSIIEVLLWWFCLRQERGLDKKEFNLDDLKKI